MTDIVRNVNGKVRIYACGGAGTNIGSMLEIHRSQEEIGFAEIDIVYVDTSKSNLKDHINKTNAYILEDLDGSGKIRSENHDEINNRIRAILQQFKPADLNIVVGSAAGGSGSVIAPLLTKELLSTGIPCVVLTIGSADTRLDAQNTLKTIKSYESISKILGVPVVMSYVQNSNTTSRSEADNILFNVVMSLTLLFSRQHHELDSRDLHNWLCFNKVTTFPVQLASLTIMESKVNNDSLGSVISVATLASEGTSTALMEMPEYQCVGFLPKAIGEAVLSKAPLHYVISDGIIPAAGKHLQKILTDLEQKQAARVKKVGVLSDTDKAHDTGLVL